MAATGQAPNRRPAWKALATHYRKVRALHLRDLFGGDAKRGERLTAEAVGLVLDYSEIRNRSPERKFE